MLENIMFKYFCIYLIGASLHLILAACTFYLLGIYDEYINGFPFYEKDSRWHSLSFFFLMFIFSFNLVLFFRYFVILSILYSLSN